MNVGEDVFLFIQINAVLNKLCSWGFSLFFGGVFSFGAQSILYPETHGKPLYKFRGSIAVVYFINSGYETGFVA